MSLKNWVFAFVAALIVMGCGGGGGGNGGAGGGPGGGGGTTGDSTIAAAVPAGPGQMSVVFLTGQGRAAGDLSATIRRVFFEDNLGVVETQLSPHRVLNLGEYTVQSIPLNVPMSSTQNGRSFNTFSLDVDKVRVDNGDGTFTEHPTTGVAISGATNQFPLEARSLLGRSSAIQIYLDDATISVTGGGVQFDKALFESQNLSPLTGSIPSFLSDFVGFDISNMPNRPRLSNGLTATKVMFSGDGIGLATGSSNGAFEVLTPDDSIEGVYAAPQDIPGTAIPFGTYSLVQPDPRDLTGTAKITALQGIWYEYGRVFNGIGTFEMITFPSSRDEEVQDLIAVVRNDSGVITNFYFGFVDLAAKDFALYPLSNVVSGDVDGEITGTLNSLQGVGDTNTPANVRSGRFAFNAGQALPAGFRQTGRFVVYRR